MITNLHYVSGEFRVYVGRDYNITGLENVRMLTGIGWGSHKVMLQIVADRADEEQQTGGDGAKNDGLGQYLGNQGGDGTESLSDGRHADVLSTPIEQSFETNKTFAGNETTLNSEDGQNATSTTEGQSTNEEESSHKIKYNVLQDKSQSFIIYVHLSDPPSEDELVSADVSSPPVELRYHAEPVIFFSVLWSNLFRTMYAGVGAWYTMMDYKVFFADHHRLVLIDVDPKPSKFLPLLQALTPSFPVTWLDDFESGVYKAAVFGISRDVMVAEIENEVYFEWRFEQRAVAFRSFCDRVKDIILTSGDANAAWNMRNDDTGNKMGGDVTALGTTWWSKVFNPFASFARWLIPARNPSLPHPRFMVRSLNHQTATSPPVATTSTPKKHFRVTIILRDGNTRRILNSDALIQHIRDRFPSSLITVSVHTFSNLSLRTQVSIIDSTDILITMHGAALTHTLFMRPSTYIIEIFPYAFRKHIFSNLAKIMGARYLHWQNNRLSRTVANWTHVEVNRLTDMPRERVERLPIDWFNMDSKNYWRNQDTEVDVEAVGDLVQLAIEDARREGMEEFLMFQPWEQFNNQIVGFKSACALANMLNRTLVLPHLGYRGRGLERDRNSKSKKSHRPPPPLLKETKNDEDGEGKEVVVEETDLKFFNPAEYVWHHFEHYFDATSLRSLPCRHISTDNFIALNNGRSLGTLRYHHLGDEATSEEQFREYYIRVAKVIIDAVVWETPDVYYQLNKTKLLELYGRGDGIVGRVKNAAEVDDVERPGKARVLGLGSMFWFYDFGIQQEYPLRRFVWEYMGTSSFPSTIPSSSSLSAAAIQSTGETAVEEVARRADPIYREITKSLVYRDHLVAIAEQIMAENGWGGLDGETTRRYNTSDVNKGKVVAIHLRRGDYLGKCLQLRPPDVQNPDTQADHDENEKAPIPAHTSTNTTDASSQHPPHADITSDIPKSCYQTSSYIYEKLASLYPPEEFPTIYISTNLPADE
ncbi:Protein O-linked-mannose beta-1,4-N-acetylglucosaminyltransferase 2, partial [Quaeritorhiza haematococci]